MARGGLATIPKLNWGDNRLVGQKLIASKTKIHPRSFVKLKSSLGVISTFLGSIGRLLQFRVLLLDFGQSRGAYFVLPNDGSTSTTGDENSDAAKNESPHFETGKWFAFPLFLICIGSAGVFFGLYFTYIHRREWRLAYGLGSITAGLCLFLWGLNLILVHMFFNVTQKY